MKEKRITRYPNDLNLNDLGFLRSVSQDVFINILTEFTSTKSTKIEISLEKLKASSRLSRKSDEKFLEHLQDVNRDLMKELVFSVKYSDGGFYTSNLFTYFFITPDGNLQTEINEKFAEALYEYKTAFTKFPTEEFIDVRGKYTKSLYRLFRKNHKGKCNMPIDELKNWLCLSRAYATNNLRKVLQKAIDELKEKEIVNAACFEFIYSEGRGRPLKVCIFEYTFNDKKILEMQGQTTLDYEPVIEEKVKMTTNIVNDPSGLPHIETTKTTIQEEKKCPKCGSKVIKRRVSDERKESFGKPYEKCEKNDPPCNQECDYFKWLDE
jgi:plasmid replication initiation protein